MKDYADTTIRVRYSETDQMGLAHHSNHLIWFEAGRVELCRQLGFEYKQMEIEDDSFIVVAEVSCRYKRPARFDDVLTIRTRVTQSQRRTIRFGYEILDRANESDRYRRNAARDLRPLWPSEIIARKVQETVSPSNTESDVKP